MEYSDRYKYYFFDKENSILYHEINNENCDTIENFVLSMSYFITLIDKYRPKSLIIKVFKKPDYFELELQSFMQKTLFKLICELNIRKVAFCIFHKEYIKELKEYERDNSLKVSFFLDLEEAKQWVISPD